MRLKQHETEDAEAQEALKSEIHKGVENEPSSLLDFNELRTRAL
jgi:hypothetical protein